MRRSSGYLSWMEWRCLPSCSIDLVVIDPESARTAQAGWGTGRSRIAKTLPLPTAVQIKRGGDHATPPGHVQKDLRDNKEVQTPDDLGKPVTYFLNWVDSRLKMSPRQTGRYIKVYDNLSDWCDESPENRTALLLCRDRVGFAFPSGAWLVQPIPPGTTEVMPVVS